MSRYSLSIGLSIVFCLVVLLGVSASRAQQDQDNKSSGVENPLARYDSLGDHTATRVLNMNGYNITNLREPFYNGDAVTLEYLERNSGWVHIENTENPDQSGKIIATRDMDFDGFDVTLDGSTLHGGTLEATALSHPEITGGNLSGISMRNSAIEIPQVIGGTFNAPVLLGPTIDKAMVTNSDMTGSRFKGDITESEISASILSDVTLTGTVSVEGGRITDLPSPNEDGDAMSRKATGDLVDDRLARLEDVIASLENMIGELRQGVAGLGESMNGLGESVNGFEESVDLVRKDIEIIKSNPVSGQVMPVEIRNSIAGLREMIKGLKTVSVIPFDTAIFDIEAALPDLVFTSRSGLDLVIRELTGVIRILSSPEIIGLADFRERIAVLERSIDIFRANHAMVYNSWDSTNKVFFPDSFSVAIADVIDWKKELGDASGIADGLNKTNAGLDENLIEPDIAMSYSTLSIPEYNLETNARYAKQAERLSGLESRIADLEAMIANPDRIDRNLQVGGNLGVDGIITGAAAQYRPTPNRAQAVGSLDGSDIIVALREMDTIVYTLSEGQYAIGIDPETVPSGMNFIMVKKDEQDRDGHDSIDYAQLIGPLIATIRHMDARIQALEAREQSGARIEKTDLE